jgi:predicted metal-dependent peptidase
MEHWKIDLLSFLNGKHDKRIALAVDVSAGMPETPVFEVIQLLIQNNFDAKVVLSDVKIQKIYDHLLDVKKLDYGRGGTCFIETIEWAEKEVDSLIYLTDGYGVAPVSSELNICWLITEGGRAPYTLDRNVPEINYGQFVNL